MNNIPSVDVNYTPNQLSNTKNGVNFRAINPAAETGNLPNDVDTFIKEQEKAKKNAKKQQYFSNFVLGSIAIGSLGMLGMYLHDKGLLFKKSYKLFFKDLKNEKGLKDLALPDSQIDASERIQNRIENYEEIIKKGGKTGSSILFYGPPGTGKNTFAYAICKKFPNAKFLEMDISKMNSKWHGESEQNVLGTMEAAIKYAQKHPKEKIFVFIDEIDSVMMQDRSSSAKLSNDILNAFKKGFNQLTNQENIIVIGATNLKIDPKAAMYDGKILDRAMLDRFSQKILVDLPTKEQILLGIKNFYNNSQRGMIDNTLKDIKNEKWEKIAEFLAKKERETSFRKLTDILGVAAENSKKGEKLTFKDIIDSIKINKDNLHASDEELQVFLKSIGE